MPFNQHRPLARVVAAVACAFAFSGIAQAVPVVTLVPSATYFPVESLPNTLTVTATGQSHQVLLIFALTDRSRKSDI